jgi:hypothetical protein
MTPETIGYIIGLCVGAWAWYRLGNTAIRNSAREI